MARHYDKWARRQQLEAYRIYDTDLEEFPLTIDRYGDRLYVALYTAEAPEEDTTVYREQIAQALEAEPTRIHFKVRQRQSGRQQYEKLDTVRQEFPVAEHGRRFLVNLTDYLDTGLFLDHRATRKLIGERAAGKRVLNLFAYTCSFGVYAATGGAMRVDNVDLSNTYLDWGRRNFRANQLSPDRHGFVRADALQWLAEPASRAYDLIVLDPPTFSNSKMMTEVLDTQRDHVQLINQCMDLLVPGGELYFSTNYRRFKLAEDQLAGRASEITKQTLPPDFRKKNLHRCWRIVAPGADSH